MTAPIPNPIVFINKKTKVDANEITLVEADVNYIKIHFEEKAPLMVAVTLKKIENLLNVHGFLRIHKKFVVNLNYVDFSLLDEEVVTIQNNIEIRVSRRKRSTLRRNLKKKQ